jgi:hypothetical protein
MVNCAYTQILTIISLWYFEGRNIPGPTSSSPPGKKKIERKRPKLCSQEGGPDWAHAMRELLVACTKWLQEMIIVSVLAVLVHISYPIHATHTIHTFVWRKLKSHTLEPSTYQQSTSWIHFLYLTAWCMSRSNAKAYHWLYSHCVPSFILSFPSFFPVVPVVIMTFLNSTSRFTIWKDQGSPIGLCPCDLLLQAK